jgi:hypothetical protein
MTLQRRTPLRKVSLKKEEKKRMGLSEMKKSGLVQKASEFTSKPRKALKARSPNNRGGQKALFESIWNSRPHCCEVCKATILQPAPWNFSHLLPKGTYPDFKLREDNIVIKCKECHDSWHLWGQRVLSMVPMWKEVVAKFRALRDEANNVEP